MDFSTPTQPKNLGVPLLGDTTLRTLFETMHEGFAFHEVICNDAGEVIDYCFLEINPAFEQLTGLKRETTVGRTVREVLPGIENEWINCFGKVALTGIPDERENYVRALDRYYRARAYSPEKGKFAVVFEETTAQRRAQRELERREALYNDLVETAADLIWRCDNEGRYIFLNKAWETIFGYPRNEMLGHHFTDFMTSKQAARNSAMFAHLLATSGQVINHETVHLRKDGTTVYLVFNARFYYDETGRVIGTQGTAHDISARKEAEAELRHTKSQLEAIFDAMPDLMFLVDRDGVLMDFRSSRCDLLYSTSEQFLGKKITDVLPEKPALIVMSALEEAVRTGRHQGAIYELTLPQGLTWFELSIASMEGGQNTDDRYVMLTRDITARKQAEDSLLEREEQLRLALFASSQGIYDLNVQTGEAKTNDEYATMLGYDPATFRETNERWLERLHPDDHARTQETYRCYVNGELPLYSIEFRQRTASGNWKWILSTGKIIERDRDGSPLRMLGTHIDITERKQSEEERLKLEQQLLHAQKLESLGVLAGGIAHDFNNILTSIIGNADLALMRLNRESPAIDNLHRIEKAAARAADLAKQMLAYSGKGKFMVEHIDLNRLVEEMGHMLEVSISKKAVLRYNLHPRLPSVEVDTTQIRQIVMNLVINASEAIGDRSGVIAISTGCMNCDRTYLEDVWLNQKISEGLYVYLEIADTGCGMDKETLARIFDPFFTTKFTGRGLGMAAVQGIIRGHKGSIKVYSEPGKGSTFKVLLPAGEKPAELFNYTATPDDWRGSGTVLLVDDEETVRAIGTEMLQELGFEVVTAADGREALEIYRSRNDICLVITDLTMPHMDGEECFRELRQLNPDVKVIMCSGFSEHEVTRKFVGKGLAGFIQKPYKLSVLKDAVRRIS